MKRERYTAQLACYYDLSSELQYLVDYKEVRGRYKPVRVKIGSIDEPNEFYIQEIVVDEAGDITLISD